MGARCRAAIKGAKNLLSVKPSRVVKKAISRTQLKCVWVGKGDCYWGGARRGQATSAPRVIFLVLYIIVILFSPPFTPRLY